MVFGINYSNLVKSNHSVMSQELFEFSEKIDEQFEIADIENEDFWEAIVNLFI